MGRPHDDEGTTTCGNVLLFGFWQGSAREWLWMRQVRREEERVGQGSEGSGSESVEGLDERGSLGNVRGSSGVWRRAKVG